MRYTHVQTISKVTKSRPSTKMHRGQIFYDLPSLGEILRTSATNKRVLSNNPAPSNGDDGLARHKAADVHNQPSALFLRGTLYQGRPTLNDSWSTSEFF